MPIDVDKISDKVAAMLALDSSIAELKTRLAAAKAAHDAPLVKTVGTNLVEAYEFKRVT